MDKKKAKNNEKKAKKSPFVYKITDMRTKYLII